MQPGDVVTVAFIGADGAKRRPAVVISSTVYHETRPDIIIGLLTSNISAATQPTDYVLQDYDEAGLYSESAFRSYLNMVLPSALTKIGSLSARDWIQVQRRIKITFGLDE